jgi:hypothetical protein
MEPARTSENLALLPRFQPAGRGTPAAQVCRAEVVLRTVVLAALLSTGCDGLISPVGSPAGPGQAGPGPSQIGTPQPVAPAMGPALAMQRLTLAQLRTAITALLGPVTLSTSSLDDVPIDITQPASYSSTSAAMIGWSQGSVDALMELAASAAHEVLGDTARRAVLVGCTPQDPADSCAKAFIEGFGRRAFRRPLEDDEVQRYLGLSTSVATALGADSWSGLEGVVTAMLQSPSFLYRVEAGVTDPEVQGRVKLTGYELATRLAFTLTAAPPDDALLDQAAAGGLESSEQVRAAALALMSSSGTAGLGAFFEEYFGAPALDGLQRDGMTPTLGAAMHQELRLRVGDLLQRDADFRDLLTSRDAFVNGELASDYGIDGVTGDAFVKLTIPGNWERVGLVGLGGMLSLNALPSRGSPTLRGRFISQRLLCQQIAPPPANVNTNLPAPASGPETMRQRLAEHTTNPACSGCHGVMDPLGLSLEHFDEKGAFRDTDNGLTLDTSGTFEGIAYEGAPGLAQALRQSPRLSPCIVRQLYRFVAGAVERPDDADLITQLSAGYDAQSSVRTAAAALLSSDTFRYAAAP